MSTGLPMDNVNEHKKGRPRFENCDNDCGSGGCGDERADRYSANDFGISPGSAAEISKMSIRNPPWKSEKIFTLLTVRKRDDICRIYELVCIPEARTLRHTSQRHSEDVSCHTPLYSVSSFLVC